MNSLLKIHFAGVAPLPSKASRHSPVPNTTKPHSKIRYQNTNMGSQRLNTQLCAASPSNPTLADSTNAHRT